MNMNLINYIFSGPDSADMSDPAIAEYDASQLADKRKWYAGNIQEIEEALVAPIDPEHEAELRKRLRNSQYALSVL